MRLTKLAHALLGASLRPGDTVLDATAGNGHDTMFLARQVGPSGRVYAMDIQEAALTSARARLAAESLDARVTWIPGDHAHLAELLPENTKGRLRAVVFNLGYLPGGDRSVTTRAASTCAALESVLALLGPAGLLSVTCYRGHPGGDTEYHVVREWFTRQGDRLANVRCHTPEKRRDPPVLLFAETAAKKWQAH